MTPLRTVMLFALIGFLNTAFAYLVYAASLYVGLPYPVAIILSMAASILVGFVGQGRLVFRNSDPSRIVRYVVMWGLLLLVHTAIVNRSVAYGFTTYVGGLLAILPVVSLSYVIQKYYVFKRESAAGRDRV